MGPSWPNCSLVLCTWPMKSMKPSPDFGTPCSGQSVNWNCRTVRDWPSWDRHRALGPTAGGAGGRAVPTCHPPSCSCDQPMLHCPLPCAQEYRVPVSHWEANPSSHTDTYAVHLRGPNAPFCPSPVLPTTPKGTRGTFILCQCPPCLAQDPTSLCHPWAPSAPTGTGNPSPSTSSTPSILPHPEGPSFTAHQE
jgi:hypothetical protein